jgi:hypothetical protein
LSQSYLKKLPTQNSQARKADFFCIIKKSYWNVSNNRNNIFLSNLKVSRHSPQNSMIIGHIEKLWKFIQVPSNIKRKRHNLKTTQVKASKFSPELEYTWNSTPTKLITFGALELKLSI